MPRLIAQLSALLGLLWLAVRLGGGAAEERAVLTAAVVALSAYVAGVLVLAGARVVRGAAPPAAPPADPSAEPDAPAAS